MKIGGAGGSWMVFAATRSLSESCLTKGDFTVIRQPVPNGAPGREALAYICASMAFGLDLATQTRSGWALSILNGDMPARSRARATRPNVYRLPVGTAPARS